MIRSNRQRRAMFARLNSKISFNRDIPIKNIETRWDRKTDRSNVLHSGDYTIDKEKSGMYHLADSDHKSGFVSIKHGHWVVKKDLNKILTQ